MAYSFDDAKAPDRRATQYFEIAANRGVYHEGWFTGTVHKAPWEGKPRRPLAEDVWELYHAAEDFSMAHDLAAENPAKLAELQQLFTQEAIEHRVLPIDDRTIERFDPKIAGRPDVMGGRKEWTVYPGMVYMTENVFIDIKNSSFDLEAAVEIGGGTAQGVLLAQGGRFGGWSFWVRQGKPAFSYNYLGTELQRIEGTQQIPAGAHTLRVAFDYDGPAGTRGAGGTVSLFIDGQKVGEGKLARKPARSHSTTRPTPESTPGLRSIRPTEKGRATPFPVC
jgi:arylsulfatase